MVVMVRNGGEGERGRGGGVRRWGRVTLAVHPVLRNIAQDSLPPCARGVSMHAIERELEEQREGGTRSGALSRRQSEHCIGAQYSGGGASNAD